MALEEVFVRALAPERLTGLIGPERAERFLATAAAAEDALRGRVVLNVNSTATGGGVAELLQTLLAYARGVGIDATLGRRRGRPRVLRDHQAHPQRPLRDARRRRPARPRRAPSVYEATLQPQRRASCSRSSAPATSCCCTTRRPPALAPRAGRAPGSRVVWRCHVGIDDPNEHSERAWDFLRPYLEDVDAYVFSREQFAPPWVARDRLAVIPPSIDPFSAKNEPIDAAEVARILQYVGLLDGGGEPPVAVVHPPRRLARTRRTATSTSSRPDRRRRPTRRSCSRPHAGTR